MKVLIAYYSRTGRTKKAAERLRELLAQSGGRNVEVATEEIVDTKSRSGFLGWLGAAKDATLRRAVPIGPVRSDPAGHDLVVIGTPVWAWTVSAAVRTYCAEHGSKAKKVAFYCTMGQSGDEGAFEVMQRLCGKAPVATLALIDRHVVREDEAGFLAKVGEFAAKLLGSGAGG